MDATFVPWLWASVNTTGERQLFPLSDLTFVVPQRWSVRQLCAFMSAVETNLAAARKQTSPATGLDGLIAPPKH